MHWKQARCYQRQLVQLAAGPLHLPGAGQIYANAPWICKLQGALPFVVNHQKMSQGSLRLTKEQFGKDSSAGVLESCRRKEGLMITEPEVKSAFWSRSFFSIFRISESTVEDSAAMLSATASASCFIRHPFPVPILRHILRYLGSVYWQPFIYSAFPFLVPDASYQAFQLCQLKI